MFGARARLEGRIATLETNLAECIVRTEVAQMMCLAALDKTLSQRCRDGLPCVQWMRDMKAVILAYVGRVQPDLADAAIEYAGGLLQPYWRAAAEYDEFNGIEPPPPRG